MSGASATSGSDAEPTRPIWTEPGMPLSTMPPFGSTVCGPRKSKNFMSSVPAVSVAMILPLSSTSWEAPQSCFWLTILGSDPSPAIVTSECILAEAPMSDEKSRWSPVKNRIVGNGGAGVPGRVEPGTVMTNRLPFLVQTEFGMKALNQKVRDSRLVVFGEGVLVAAEAVPGLGGMVRTSLPFPHSFVYCGFSFCRATKSMEYPFIRDNFWAIW